MKIKLLITLFFLSSIVFSQQQFSSDEYGFSIIFPDLWKVEKGTQPMVAVIARLSTASINVVIQENDKYRDIDIIDVDISNFRNELEGKYKVYFKNFKSLDCGRITVNSYNAISFAYNCDINNDVLYAKQYFLFKDNKIYVISTGCLESEYANFFEIVFNESVNSFTFNK